MEAKLENLPHEDAQLPVVREDVSQEDVEAMAMYLENGCVPDEYLMKFQSEGGTVTIEPEDTALSEPPASD